MSESELGDMDEAMDLKEDDSCSNSAEGSSDEEDADEEKLLEIQRQVGCFDFSCLQIKYIPFWQPK